MRCWRCGQPLADGTDRCGACGVKQDRTVPTTDIGRELRRLYDSLGAKEMLSSEDLIISALDRLGDGARKVKGFFRIAMDAGIGRLYLEQLRTAKRYDRAFVNQVYQYLSDAGMNYQAAYTVIVCLNEMIGWKEKKERPTDKTSKIIGIDLGGSTARAAVIEGGEPFLIPNQSGGYGVPSAAGIKDGILTAGEEALKQSVSRPDETSLFFKTKMGTDATATLDGKRYPPQFLSALVLRKLRMDASDYLGQDVVEAVVTVPNGYTNRQRQAVIDAGRMAGLKVVRVINNTSVGALDISRRVKDCPAMLICSMGSTSLDVSVMQIENGIVETIGSGGDSGLGGRDFTEAIVRWALNRFEKKEGIDLGKDSVMLARIREAAETAKKELSASLSAQVFLPYAAMRDGKPVHLELTLTRAGFNELTASLREKATGLIQRVIHDAGIQAEDIKMAVFSGGGSRMPAIRDAVRQIVGNEVRFTDAQDDSAAKGAAVLGGILCGEIESTILLETTANSFGIETAGGVCTKLIRRNTTYPAKQVQTFSTSADNQTTMDIRLLEGESDKASDNEVFGTYRIHGIPPARKGIPEIEVTYSIDANGIFRVTAKDTGTGKEYGMTALDRSAAAEELIRSGATLVETIADHWMED